MDDVRVAEPRAQARRDRVAERAAAAGHREQPDRLRDHGEPRVLEHDARFGRIDRVTCRTAAAARRSFRRACARGSGRTCRDMPGSTCRRGDRPTLRPRSRRARAARGPAGSACASSLGAAQSPAPPGGASNMSRSARRSPRAFAQTRTSRGSPRAARASVRLDGRRSPRARRRVNRTQAAIGASSAACEASRRCRSAVSLRLCCASACSSPPIARAARRAARRSRWSARSSSCAAAWRKPSATSASRAGSAASAASRASEHGELGLTGGPERVARRDVERGRREAVHEPGAAEHAGERAQVADATVRCSDDERAEHLARAGRVEAEPGGQGADELGDGTPRDRMRLGRERARHPHR